MPTPPRVSGRTLAGLLLAGAAIAVAMPAELAPWAAPLRAALRSGWPAGTVALGLVLVIAGRLLPAPSERLPRLDHSGLTVGLLLLLEPLLHLGVLAVCAGAASRFATEALLPAAPPRFTPNAALLTRVLVFAVLAPVCEEYFFRGRLLPWLRGHLGTASAVSISACAFAIAHGDLVQAAVALPVGLLLAGMRVAGADLGACMLAHAIHNGLFLVGGAGLVALPWIGPAMAGSGAVLAAFAWIYHLRPRPAPHRRFLLAVLLSATVVAAALPGYRRLADRGWVAGTHRLLVWWRIGNEDLLARLLAQERGNRLWAGRRAALTQRLLTQPCQTRPRQAGALALLDPGVCTPDGGDAAFDLLAELATASRPGAANGEIARRVGRCWPDAFAAVAGEYPEALPRWLPLPERADAAAAQLAATEDGHDRKQLLGALERAQPGRVAAVLFALPAAAVTPLDARHLRLHYPDARALLGELAARDPQRAAAFGHAGDASP